MFLKDSQCFLFLALKHFSIEIFVNNQTELFGTVRKYYKLVDITKKDIIFILNEKEIMILIKADLNKK